MVDILIKNGTIITMNERREIIQDGFLAVDKGRIVDVGKSEQTREKYSPDRVVDAQGHIIMPGFINTHTHVDNILLRGLGQDRNLADWLENVNFPGVWAMTADDCRIASALFCTEAILSGITTIVDNSTWGMGGRKAEELAEPTIEIYRKVGIRAVYGRMVADYISPDMEKITEQLRKKEPEILHVPLEQVDLESPSEARREIEKLMRKYHLTENGRIQIWPSPVKPGLNTDESLLACSELAEKHCSMVTMHLDETRMDAVMDKKRYGVTNIEHLDSIGFLNNRLLAGHCVWVSDKDITLLKKKDVKAAHLAVCNMYIGSGIAPIVEMLRKAIIVGIGTDDANCTDNVNMIQTMKATALLQKVRTLDASAITAEKVLEMATIDGARAIGMQDDIGSLEKGKKADVIILNTEHPNLKPMHNIPAAIVYQAYGNEIETAIVDGKILMENRTIPSINSLYGDRLFDLVQEAAEEIIERAGMQKIRNRKWTIPQRKADL